MASWGGFFKGLGKAGKFVYDHPEFLAVVAGVATGNPAAIAAGAATVVKAREKTNEIAPVPAPPVAAPPAPEPPVAIPVVETPGAIAPEVDLRGKWRGTLDRMSIQILGYPLTDEREVYDNAVLLEKGDVDGVIKNLQGKK